MKTRTHNHNIIKVTAISLALCVSAAASAQPQYTDEICLLAVGGGGTGNKVGGGGTGAPELACQNQNKSLWQWLFR